MSDLDPQSQSKDRYDSQRGSYPSFLEVSASRDCDAYDGAQSSRNHEAKRKRNEWYRTTKASRLGQGQQKKIEVTMTQ